MSERVVRIRLARPIKRLLASVVRFLLIEGAMRASKTWGCLIKWRKRVEDYPGIALVMARWNEGDLNTKLVPDYRKVCDLMGLPYGAWNARESCFEFGNGSRLYAIHLKSSEKATIHGKPRGFTVAGVYISQLEEVPYDVAREWMLRLSQPGYPHQFLADANPVHDGHWIAQEWPADNSKPDHEYLTASIWDNAHNLDASTIEAAEALYPPGHPMRPAKLEGKRGANTEGDPVYGEYYRPAVHNYHELEPWPYAPIVVGWDFGAKHPAVSFNQFLPWGAFWHLGAVMGDNVMLEWFAPRVLRIASEWFHGMPLLHCGDPAGEQRSSQGLSLNAKTYLSELRVCPKCFSDKVQKHGERQHRCNECETIVTPIAVDLRTQPDSNDLRVRYGCIQTWGGYMLRTTRRFKFFSDETVLQAESFLATRGRSVGQHDVMRPRFEEDEEPAFLLNPRGLLISRKKEQPISIVEQALGGGYIWDDDFHGVGNLANIRRPLKDGFFEHVMNATEYTIHNYVPARPSEDVLLENWVKAQREQLKRVTDRMFVKPLPPDHDPADKRYGKGKFRNQGTGSRGGAPSARMTRR